MQNCYFASFTVVLNIATITCEQASQSVFLTLEFSLSCIILHPGADTSHQKLFAYPSMQLLSCTGANAPLQSIATYLCTYVSKESCSA